MFLPFIRIRAQSSDIALPYYGWLLFYLTRGIAHYDLHEPVILVILRSFYLHAVSVFFCCWLFDVFTGVFLFFVFYLPHNF